ncbi:peptide deformylase [Crocosphaera sp.]|uniref:peptide deformylase n=1 Tax=Crocosphaera sp. TaxID=2729996 RepID=UPI00260223A6|nr:peptide deformylase [Crocosphaera sp.]MDJ0579222.1 peptide deformylase [Crocosphaera sp.]
MINLDLEIAQVGNPILRQQAQLVQDITDEKLQQLMDNLLSIARDANGVGIAAPQVSESYRLFVICSHPNPRYPDAPMMEPTIMINPRIVSHSDEIVKDWEGCLSVPGLRGLVPRYKMITVEYLDRYGKFQQQELRDFVARIFQHELDHLNGILFIDRVEKSEDLVEKKSLSVS